MKGLKERIDEIMVLVAEVANGNFDYQLDASETGDQELDALISGVSMLGQELKSSTVSRDLLKKLTDHLPGAIYQFEVSLEGKMAMPFISKGVTEFHPSLTPEALKNDLEVLFKLIHPDDLPTFQESIQTTISGQKDWFLEFRLIGEQGQICWLMARSKVERKPDGTTIWYGVIREITESKEYINTLERILFDISHIMRRPIANLLGLTELLEGKNQDEKNQALILNYIKTASLELDSYIKELAQSYSDLQLKVKGTNSTKTTPEK